MNWKYYPTNTKPTDDIYDLINIFESHSHLIDSEKYTYVSNDVLNIVSENLIKHGYKVETGKKSKEKIRIPVLYGVNGKETLSFEADTFSLEKKIVIEVEAWRIVTNYQFLKDFFQACMMNNVDYLCICVRNVYRENQKDFEIVSKFFDLLYSSQRMLIPLKGVLIIGYKKMRCWNAKKLR